MHTTTTKEEEDRSEDSSDCQRCDHFAAPLIGLIVSVRRDLLTLGQKQRCSSLLAPPLPAIKNSRLRAATLLARSDSTFRGRRIVRVLDRKVGFNREQIGESVALLIGELAAKTVRSSGWPGAEAPASRADRGRRGPPGGDGPGEVRGTAASALRTCCRCGGVRCSIASVRSSMRRRCSGVMLLSWRETVAHALLRLRGKIAEAGFILKRALLLRRAEGCCDDPSTRPGAPGFPLGRPWISVRVRSLGRRASVPACGQRMDAGWAANTALLTIDSRAARAGRKNAPQVGLKCHGDSAGKVSFATVGVIAVPLQQLTAF